MLNSALKKGKILSLLLTLAFTMLFISTPKASALSIVRNFLGGTASSNAAGGGSLETIFNAAAGWWEQAILDTHTVRIDYLWEPQPIETAAMHYLTEQGGTPHRQTAALISFDNSSAISWFMDATPDDHSEYATYTESSTLNPQNNESFNYGRVYSNPTDPAANHIDLFTVALHEIGHSLGLSSSNLALQKELEEDIDMNNLDLNDFNIDVEVPLPHAGLEFQVSGAHLSIDSSLMASFIEPGTRRLISAMDILANAEVSKFTNVNLNPYQPSVVVPEPTNPPVPEPGTALLLVVGLIALVIPARKKLLKK